MSHPSKSHVSRTIWTALLIVIVILGALLIAYQNQSKADTVDSAYPFGPSNGPLVGAVLQGVVHFQNDTTISPDTQRLEVFKLSDSNKPITLSNESPFRYETTQATPIPGDSTLNQPYRLYYHTAGLHKGQAYRIIMFNKNDSQSKQLNSCYYTDFFVPWITPPFIVFSSHPSGAIGGSVALPGSTTAKPLPTLEYSSSCPDHTPVSRDPRPTPPTAGVHTYSGVLHIDTTNSLYPYTLLSSPNTKEKDDIGTAAVPPTLSFSALTGVPLSAKTDIKSSFTCYQKNVGNTTARIRVTGTWKLINTVVGNRVFFAVDSTKAFDAALSTKCDAS